MTTAPTNEMLALADGHKSLGRRTDAELEALFGNMYSGWERGVNVTQERFGDGETRFTETPMTELELAARFVAAEIGSNIYEIANKAAFAPIIVYSQIQARLGPLYSRLASSPSARDVREALEPFAKIYQLMDCTSGAHEYSDTDTWEVPVGLLRRADDTLSNLDAAAPAAGGDALVLQWRDGAPPKPWCDEWFIAETTFSDRVVLTALPEEYSYDFKTADDTYIKADNIKRWMQFPDSNFIAPETTDAASSNEAEFWCRLAGRAIDALDALAADDCDWTGTHARQEFAEFSAKELRAKYEGLSIAAPPLQAPADSDTVRELEPWRAELEEITSHLDAAIMQSTDSDDKIIMDHVKAAHEIAKIIRRKA